ncbi:MAG: ComF family protein [Syntrophomonadaceae bacterium]
MLAEYFLDILFPQSTCCICRKPGRYTSKNPWCSECNETMAELRQGVVCIKCGKYLEEEEATLCLDCQKNPPEFHISRAVGPYDKPYRKAIKILKFLGKKIVANQMGSMMAEVVANEPRFWPIDLIVPVPSSPSRLKQRGFNQTSLLASKISKRIKVKMNPDVLIRIKETPSQRELTRQEREINLRRAFAVQNPSVIRNQNLLLVDDVYTTGSTSRECTRTLLEAGASRVSIITWATGRGY